MSSKYETFDRSQLHIKPLAERENDLQIDNWLELEERAGTYEHPNLPALADQMAA